ncbi:MAG TPA: hypothetical protein VHO95_05760 [Candidatus Dormibacteraeota bacterium]|nr:hypothetical protein [Candidatus Dormibacteraeota bacterium]
MILLGACAAPALPQTGSPTQCTNSPPHRAYVVVEHMSGTLVQRCVGFSGETIEGQALMDQSGVEYQARSVSSGKVVCQVDNEPAQFSECFPQNRPYWALFVDAGGHWSSAGGGFTDLKVVDGGAIGWHYVQATDPSPSPPPLPRLA